tara:strand:- start:191 stop:994 length:804 start_codon:yes stop_codon:yes gene_type:complete
MALYDTRFGLPQAVADYLNQGLPSIQQPYRPGYDKDYGPKEGTGYTTVMPQPGYQYVYGPDGQRYSIPIPGYNPNEDAESSVGLTPEQLKLLYPQTGGGDDGYRGGGDFGNLDLSRSKTFTKDIYDEEEGDFVPTELTAHYNPTLGNYQTFEGKNINPAFSNRGLPTFGLGSLAMNILGMTPKTVGGYVPGSIRGFYDSPMDLIKRRKNEQERTTAQIAASKQADVAKADALRAIRDTGQDRSPSQRQRDAGPGFSGSGSAAEMGSF